MDVESIVFVGNCEDVLFSDEIHPLSIDLVVTSPPYDNLRKYYGNDGLISRETSDDNEIALTTLIDRAPFQFCIRKVISGLARVVKAGGVVVWVATDSCVLGARTGTVHLTAAAFMESGSFVLHDTMVWLKDSSSHASVFGKSTRYSNVFETMLVFVKKHDNAPISARIRPRVVNLIVDRANKTAGATRSTMYTKRDMKVIGSPRIKEQNAASRITKKVVVPAFGVRNNVWFCNSRSRKKNISGHPAVMPLSIAVDHVLTWSNAGDLILDPFAGSGTTLIAALTNDRRCIGIELSPEYASIIEERISK